MALDRATPREVWITGFGLVSHLGSEPDQVWRRLGDPSARRDPAAPRPVTGFDLDTWVPRKHQRYMGPLMWYGVGAAAQALAMAEVTTGALRARLGIMVACGNGERDDRADQSVLAELLAHPPAAQALLNAQLTEKLRPSLFLAQLPNLLASNISIVSSLTGPSRTLLGEEGAGFECLRLAFARLAAGQAEILLVGGGFNAESHEHVLGLRAAGALGALSTDPWDAPGGLVLGSGAAFLVLETAEHARSRNAVARAVLDGGLGVLGDRRGEPTPDTSTRRVAAWLAQRATPGRWAVVSGASGDPVAVGLERRMLEPLIARGQVSHVRQTASTFGHLFEGTPFLNTCLAAMCVARGEVFPPQLPSGFEDGSGASLIDGVIVTCVGFQASEAALLVKGPT